MDRCSSCTVQKSKNMKPWTSQARNVLITRLVVKNMWSKLKKNTLINTHKMKLFSKNALRKCKC